MTEPEMEQNTAAAQQEEKKEAEKFCKFCGSKIAEDAVICPCCGRQVEALKGSSEGSPHIVITAEPVHGSSASIAGVISRE